MGVKIGNLIAHKNILRLIRKSKLIRSSILAFILRGIGAASAFVMSLAITNSLPPTEAGYFFLGLAWATALIPVGLLGTGAASLRFIGAWFAEAEWGKIRYTASITRKWALFALMFCFFAVILAAPPIAKNTFNDSEFSNVLRIFGFSIVLFGLSNLVATQLQAIRSITRSITLLTISAPILVTLFLFFLPIETAMYAAIAYNFAGLITLLSGLYLWKKVVPFKRTTSIRKDELRISCKHLWLTGVLITITTWCSQLVAGVWVSAEEFAYLSVTQRTANLVSFILVAVNYVVAPEFASLYKQNQTEELRKLALQAVKLMVALALPVLIALCLFSEKILALFGNEYRDAAPLLIIMSLGQFINVVTGPVGFLLNMSGHEKDMRNVVMCSATFAVLVSFTLTFYFGLIGAAVATAASVSAQNLGALWMVRKRLGFNMLAIWG